MGVIILSEREMSEEMDDVKRKDDVVVDENPGDNSNAGEENDTDGDVSETNKAVADENPCDDVNTDKTDKTDGDISEIDGDVAAEPSVEDDKQAKAKPRTRKGRTNTKKD